MNKKEYLRQFLSDFLQGTNFEALLGTLADEAQKQEDLAISVNNQLYFSTASEEYLDKVLSQVGITRPSELGMEDLAFRQMGIQINARKQITEVLHTVLETFFGNETVRAMAQSTISAPYVLEDGDELFLELESGEILTIPFFASDFANVTEASAQEVADVISRFTRSQGINSFASAFTDTLTGKSYVRIFGAAKGPYSMVRILGGQIQSKLEFPSMRNTKLAINNTVWEITRTIGSTIRFRWYSGPQPLLSSVVTGDSVLMYGDAFINAGISGTFTITNVRPSGITPSYDAGWFEIDSSAMQGLRSTVPDMPPQPNTVTDTYSILVPQTSYDDLKFYLPKKHVPYNQTRYALAFEAKRNLLKIYIPATTKVVRRDLVGSAHLHPLYDQYNLNGSFGHATDKEHQIEIVSSHEIKYRQNGYDNIASGGVLQYGSTEIEIDYVSRSNGFTLVKTLEPHLLTGDKEWTTTKNFAVGDEAFFENAVWTANLASGPANGGARQPQTLDMTYWTYKGTGLNLSSTLVSVTVNEISAEDIYNPFQGPYVVDPTAPYTLTDVVVTTRERILAGTKLKTLFIQGDMPSDQGLLLFGLNSEKQEGPIKVFNAQIANAPTTVSITNISQNGYAITVNCSAPHGAIPSSQVQISGMTTVPSLNGSYIVDSVPSPTVYTCTATFSQIASAVSEGSSATILSGSAATLILDPSYTFKYTHDIGTDVTLLSDRIAYTPDIDGSDYSFYLTGTTEGRIFCEDLLKQITALGINFEIVVLYPKGIGFGNGEEPLDGEKYNDVLHIWG